MKLPKEIQGKNRLRDLGICDMYISGLSAYEIFDVLRYRQRPLSLRRIHSILSNNSAFINPRIGWTKTKRLHRLQQVAGKTGDHLSNRKDILDVIEQIRVEVEGPKPGIVVNQDNSKHITQVFLSDKLKSARERVKNSGREQTASSSEPRTAVSQSVNA